MKGVLFKKIFKFFYPNLKSSNCAVQVFVSKYNLVQWWPGIYQESFYFTIYGSKEQ